MPPLSFEHLGCRILALRVAFFCFLVLGFGSLCCLVLRSRHGFAMSLCGFGLMMRVRQGRLGGCRVQGLGVRIQPPHGGRLPSMQMPLGHKHFTAVTENTYTPAA